MWKNLFLQKFVIFLTLITAEAYLAYTSVFRGQKFMSSLHKTYLIDGANNFGLALFNLGYKILK